MPLFSLSRPLLRGLAVLFALAVTLYSGVWMYSARKESTAYLGIDYDFQESTGRLVFTAVKEGTPASRAGLLAGDVIVAINGEKVQSEEPFGRVVVQGHPGDRVQFAVERKGLTAPLALEAVLAPADLRHVPLSEKVALQVISSYPLLFLVVSVAVLLLRPEDRAAWALALAFAGLIAMAPSFSYWVPYALRGFTVAYKIALDGSAPALFLYFFSIFPVSSPLDRKAPWLKWLWMGLGVPLALGLAVWAAWARAEEPIEVWARHLPLSPGLPLLLYFFGGFLLGLLSLVLNAAQGTSAVRRKSRVIVWGTVAGFGPFLLLALASSYAHESVYTFPFWIWTTCVMFMFLIPVSFAYAVLRQNVLEIPVLLRRSARYLLVQRGSVGLLLVAGIAVALGFSLSLAKVLGLGSEAAAIGLGVLFGTVLVSAGVQLQRRLRGRIDRAFFRGAYDARVILEDLAERARFAMSREDLAALLEDQVRSALYPSFLGVYFNRGGGDLDLVRGGSKGPRSLPVASLSALVATGVPRELSEEERVSLGADCLVPILGRGGRLSGVLALGGRLSEEPYSGEDKRLLASVASQVGITLENISLAEQMAARLEADRRAAHEMELAKQVQGKLLPQSSPSLETLECGACCVQARAVGGDYYDFLELGGRRLGLVLADISGKGFPAALLMANLQATLRSRSGEDLSDLPGQLKMVNTLLYRSSEPNRYATLFLGVYDDSRRRLCYANCGHNPPVLLRASGKVERLMPTAPVVGLLEEKWFCETGEVSLGPGDLLVIFSDGITEAWSGDGEEFGEARLIDFLTAHRDLPVGSLIDLLLKTVQEFSGKEQGDDQTVVVARGL